MDEHGKRKEHRWGGTTQGGFRHCLFKTISKESGRQERVKQSNNLYWPDLSWTWKMKQHGQDTEWLSWYFLFSLLLTPHCRKRHKKALNTQYASTTGVIHIRSNTDPNEYRVAHNNKYARFSITLRLTAFLIACRNSFQDLGWVVNLRICASA